MKPRYRDEEISGWGMFPVEKCSIYRPETRREVKNVVADGRHASYIARGCGRSYGDASLNRSSGVISQLRINRMLDFDDDDGVLECEGGTTIREIVSTFLPRGFYPCITPGTGHVTVGGAIAADVHGKNHHRAGSFGDCVKEIVLLLASGETVTCSEDEKRELFRATVGGMGLTGVIVRARLQLARVESPFVKVTTVRTRNLSESISALERMTEKHEHAIAWIDVLRDGEMRGRGVVQGGDHALRDELPPAIGNIAEATRPRPIRLPFKAPDWTLNRVTMSAFNSVWFRRRRPPAVVAKLEDFMYPLDRVEEWNRVYGRRGFIQYQFVVPADAARGVISTVLERLGTAGHPAFLATMKRFASGGRGFLSFPMEGISVALDMPVRAGLDTVATALDAIVADAGGRVYLAKDAYLGADAFARMYARADDFRKVKSKHDADNRFSSSLARRLGLA